MHMQAAASARPAAAPASHKSAVSPPASQPGRDWNWYCTYTSAILVQFSVNFASTPTVHIHSTAHTRNSNYVWQILMLFTPSQFIVLFLLFVSAFVWLHLAKFDFGFG